MDDYRSLDLDTIPDITAFAYSHELGDTRYEGKKVQIKEILNKNICILHHKVVNPNSENNERALLQFFFLSDSSRTLHCAESRSKFLSEFLKNHPDVAMFKTRICKKIINNAAQYRFCSSLNEEVLE